MTVPFALAERPKILVVTLRRLGDVLLTTPLVRALRRGLPNATLDILVFSDTAEMLKSNPDIDNLRTIPNKASLSQTYKAIGLRGYDLVVTTQTGDRLVFAALMAGWRRVGLVPPLSRDGGWWKRWAFTIPVMVDPDTHRIDELNRLATALCLEPSAEMVSPQGVATEAVAPAGHYAVVHPTPAHACKRWNVQGWRDLARGLAERGLQVVSTQGPAPEEAAYVDSIWAGADTPVIRERARLDWPGLAALMRGAAVYVGPDTSMAHLATANGCSTVVLFGPTRPRLIGPWPVGGLSEPWADRGTVQRRGNAWVVQHPMPCQPCDQLGCDRHENSRSQCLDDLTAQEVLVAVDQALGSKDSQAGWCGDRKAAIEGAKIGSNMTPSTARP